MGGQPFTSEDKDRLARHLLKYTENKRGFGALKEGVNSGALPNHPLSSWQTFLRDNDTDIKRRMELVKRQKARDDEAKKNGGKGKGKEKATRDDESGEDDSSSSDQAKKQSKKRKSSSTSNAATTTTTKKKRVPFDDKKDWDRLIETLAKGEKKQWEKNKIYKVLARKYPDHSESSWQTWHSQNREGASEALAIYLKDLAALENEEEEEEEEEDLQLKKKKKKSNQQSERPTTQSNSAQPVASTSKKQFDTRTTTAAKERNDNDFDPVSDSDSDSPRIVSKKAAPPPPPSARPSATASKASEKTKKSTEKRPSVVLEIDDSSSQHEHGTHSPPPRHRSRLLNEVPQAHKLRVVQPSSNLSKKVLASSTQPARTNSTTSHPKKKQKLVSSTQPAPLFRPAPPLPPPPAPAPPSFLTQAAQTPRTAAKVQSNLERARQVPLPPEDDDLAGDLEDERGGEEPDTEDEGSSDGGDDGDGGESGGVVDGDDLEDDRRLVKELVRIDWLDLTKQEGYENLSNLYPYYSSIEWADRYNSRMSHFLHQISLANEALEDESELDQVSQEYKDEKVSEELMRCELLKVERNPIAWESLNKLYPRLSEQEWKAVYGQTKRSVWGKKIGERVKLIEEDIKRRTMKGESPIRKSTKDRNVERKRKKLEIEKQNKEEQERKRKEKGKQRAQDQDQMQDVEMSVKEKTVDAPLKPVPSAPRLSATQRVSSTSSAATASKAATPGLTRTNRSPSRPREVRQSTLPHSPSPVKAATPRQSTPRPEQQPQQAQQSPSPRRRIVPNLEPPTPPKQQEPPVEASPHPSTSRREPATPEMSPPESKAQPPPSSSGTTVFHHSQYSNPPSPFKQSSQYGHLSDEIQELPRQETVDVEGQKEEDKMDQDSNLRPTRMSTANTTSSDRDLDGLLLKKTAKDTEGDLEAEDEEQQNENDGGDVKMVENSTDYDSAEDDSRSPRHRRTTKVAVVDGDTSESDEDSEGENEEDEEEKLRRPASSASPPPPRQAKSTKLSAVKDQHEKSAAEEEQGNEDVSELDDDDDDDFDPSDPFENFDPSEPIYQRLTEEEMNVVNGHLSVVKAYRSLQAKEAGIGKEKEDVEMGLGRSELQEEADELEGGGENRVDRVGTRKEEEEEKRSENGNVALSQGDVEEPQVEQVSNNTREEEEVREVTQGKKRRRSEFSNSIAPDERPPAKKARKSTTASIPSSTSSTKLEEVVKVQAEQLPPRPAPFITGSITRSPRIPRAALLAASSPRRSSHPPSASISTALTPLVPAPRQSSIPTTSTRQIKPEATRAVNQDLQRVADELKLSFEVTEKLFYCFSSPGDLNFFKRFARFYSPDGPKPGTDEYKKLEKGLKKIEWTYEEDVTLLTGTEEEKEKLKKRKSKKFYDNRIEMLKHTRKDRVEKLPLNKYHRGV